MILQIIIESIFIPWSTLRPSSRGWRGRVVFRNYIAGVVANFAVFALALAAGTLAADIGTHSSTKTLTLFHRQTSIPDVLDPFPGIIATFLGDSHVAMFDELLQTFHVSGGVLLFDIVMGSICDNIH